MINNQKSFAKLKNINASKDAVEKKHNPDNKTHGFIHSKNISKNQKNGNSYIYYHHTDSPNRSKI